MHKFSAPLALGEDANTQHAVLGFVFEKEGVFIHDPTLSSCGRFTVDPAEQYGISAIDAQELATLNTLLEDATQAAINAGCLAIQEKLGITSGDTAGASFSGGEKAAAISKALGEYLLLELNLAAQDEGE